MVPPAFSEMRKDMLPREFFENWRVFKEICYKASQKLPRISSKTDQKLRIQKFLITRDAKNQFTTCTAK